MTYEELAAENAALKERIKELESQRIADEAMHRPFLFPSQIIKHQD